MPAQHKTLPSWELRQPGTWQFFLGPHPRKTNGADALLDYAGVKDSTWLNKVREARWRMSIVVVMQSSEGLSLWYLRSTQVNSLTESSLVAGFLCEAQVSFLLLGGS